MGVAHWAYFVSSISENGHLHLPLGRWIRTPDQFFSHVLAEDGKIIYRDVTQEKWQVCRKIGHMTTRFVKENREVTSLPIKWIPVRAIETAQFMVCSTGGMEVFSNFDDNCPLENKQEVARKQVVGTYEFNETQLQKLAQRWHQSDNKIIAATDGGLKDAMGTSSYAVFLPNDQEEVLKGYAAE